jgi:hypothetical protein
MGLNKAIVAKTSKITFEIKILGYKKFLFLSKNSIGGVSPLQRES